MSVAEKLVAYVNANQQNFGDGDAESLLEIYNQQSLTFHSKMW